MSACSAFQLQAGLITPPPAALAAADRRASETPPRAITEYERLAVLTDDGLRLAVYAREDSKAVASVLFVHGAGSGAWAWERFFESLPQRFNLYALSWRGHFDSTPVADANSADYVADQFATLQAIRARSKLPVHIVGHSYGGATSVLLQSQLQRTGGPALASVASLHLLAPVVPLDYTLAQRMLIPILGPLFISTRNDPEGSYGGMFLSEKRMRYYYERYAGQEYSVERPGLIAGDGVAVAWQTRLRTAYANLAEADVPVWIYLARYDNVIVPRRTRATASRSGATMIEVASGHYLPLDIQAEALALRITTEMDRLSSR